MSEGKQFRLSEFQHLFLVPKKKNEERQFKLITPQLVALPTAAKLNLFPHSSADLTSSGRNVIGINRNAQRSQKFLAFRCSWNLICIPIADDCLEPFFIRRMT